MPWNSKKWRVWMFFSEDQTMLFMGRQYPFAVSQGIDIIKNTILKIFFISKNSPIFYGSFYFFNIIYKQSNLINKKRKSIDEKSLLIKKSKLKNICFLLSYTYEK